MLTVWEVMGSQPCLGAGRSWGHSRWEVMGSQPCANRQVSVCMCVCVCVCVCVCMYVHCERDVYENCFMLL